MPEREAAFAGPPIALEHGDVPLQTWGLIMDTDRNLLFGVLAFQKGAIDADRLAETCVAISGDQTVSVPDRLVDQGVLTVDQKVELERTLDAELMAHGGDPDA